MKTYPRHQYPLMIAIIHVLAVVGKRYVCQYNTLVKPKGLDAKFLTSTTPMFSYG